MRIVKTVAGMQRLVRQWRARRIRVALVPTMGYLHAGHLSLVQEARKLASPRGKVVASIYVNPTQFGPAEDFSRYPRDLARDARLCRAEGVDVIFTPSDAEMYPGGATGACSTYVVEERLSRVLEGASRPTHFRGVATVVAKLFNIVQPDWAVFGAKDFQQATIIQRMVADLNVPLKLVIAPTKREPDGLALSSRNKYLTGSERSQATVLWRALRHAQTAVRDAGKPLPARKLKAELQTLVRREPAARVDYIEFFDPQTLLPAADVKRGVHLALAVFIGKTRLIDNARL